MTYRHYRIPGGYQKPEFSVNRLARYAIPSNYNNPYDATQVDVLKVNLGLNGAAASFDWGAEAGRVLPAGSVFSRASAISVPTTTDGTTFWNDQTAKSGEPRFARERRLHNLVQGWDLTVGAHWIKALGGSASITVTPGFAIGPDSISGSATRVQMVTTGAGFEVCQFYSSGPGQTNGIPLVGSLWIKLNTGTSEARSLLSRGTPGSGSITITDAWQRFALTDGETSSGDARIGISNSGASANTLDILIAVGDDYGPMVELVEETNRIPSEPINPSVVYNAEVAGVKVVTTVNTSTVDGSNIVTEGTGSEIVGGGYLSEPAAIATADDILDTTEIPEQFTLFMDVTVPNPLPTGDTIVAVGTDQAGGVGFIRVSDAGVVTAFDGVSTITSTVAVVAGQRFKVAYWRDGSDHSLSVNGETPVVSPVGSSAFVGGKFRIGATSGGDHWNTEASPTLKGVIHSVKTYEDVTPNAADLTDFFL